ncbi:MAG: hypothetical protein AAB445_01275 [Patescibacteria group bacterium]
MAQRKEYEPKTPRFGLGKKEWLFVNGLLTLRLWLIIPKGATEVTVSIYGQSITTTPASSGLTLVEIPSVDPQLPPRLEITCTGATGEILIHTQDIPAEQPANTEQVDLQWRDFLDGEELFLEVGARVLSSAGRVLPPVPVRFTLANDKRDAIPTDGKGVSQTTFGPLEYNHAYQLSVATPASGVRTVPITIKPARAVKYDIIELAEEVITGMPTLFILRIVVWDDLKLVPLSGLRVNGHVSDRSDSGITDDEGIAELIFAFDLQNEVTHYRVLVEDGKEKKSYIRRPAAAPLMVVTPTTPPRNFREAFRAARDKQSNKE